MTKEELKEAIASTIVENGQKAITAESLANLLNEIVDAAGSGGGSGGGTGGGAVTIMIDESNVAPNEKNAEAFVTISNAYNNGVPVSVMAMYSLLGMPLCMPITAYFYEGEADVILLFVDLTFLFGEFICQRYTMTSDGTVTLFIEEPEEPTTE